MNLEIFARRFSGEWELESADVRGGSHELNWVHNMQSWATPQKHQPILNSVNTCCCCRSLGWQSQFRILSYIFCCWLLKKRINRFRWASSRMATLSYVFTSLYKKNSCHSIYTHDERYFLWTSREIAATKQAIESIDIDEQQSPLLHPPHSLRRVDLIIKRAKKKFDYHSK